MISISIGLILTAIFLPLLSITIILSPIGRIASAFSWRFLPVFYAVSIYLAGAEAKLYYNFFFCDLRSESTVMAWIIIIVALIVSHRSKGRLHSNYLMAKVTTLPHEDFETSLMKTMDEPVRFKIIANLILFFMCTPIWFLVLTIFPAINLWPFV